MPYFIKPVKLDQCVFVTYEGEMTRVEMMDARYEANELLSMKGWSQIVVDFTELKSVPTALDLIDLASDLSSDLPRSTRIALVVRPNQVKDAKLVESVARIEGVHLSYFFEMEEAIIWAKGMSFHERIGSQRTNSVIVE